MAVTQTSGALTTIRMMYILPPLIGSVINLILYCVLDVEKANKKLSQMKEVVNADIETE